MEALSTVKQWFLDGRLEEVEQRDGVYDFGGEHSYPKDALIPYKSQEGKGEFYSLDTLVFFAKRLGPGFKFGEYIRAGKEHGVDTIKLIDRKVRGVHARVGFFSRWVLIRGFVSFFVFF